jgi:hypothetical protein
VANTWGVTEDSLLIPFIIIHIEEEEEEEGLHTFHQLLARLE